MHPLKIPIPDTDHTLLMIPVDGNTGKYDKPFLMGDEGEGVQTVRVSSFYLAQFPVTQVLWQAVTGNAWERLAFKGDGRPMERVSWDDTQDFLKKLAQKTKTDFRLPTEAEWEYAARGGKFNSGNLYAGSPRLKEVAWFDDNSHGETKPAGRKFPNELGLYDMSGNVWEWCSDWYGPYSELEQVDPIGPEQGSLRVYRGGSWINASRYCRSAYRGHWNPGIRNDHRGFRLALSLQSVGNQPAGL